MRPSLFEVLHPFNEGIVGDVSLVLPSLTGKLFKLTVDFITDVNRDRCACQFSHSFAGIQIRNCTGRDRSDARRRSAPVKRSVHH